MECTFEEFKQAYKEFNDNLASMTLEELDNSFKCLGLLLLGMTEYMWRTSANIIWKWELKIYGS